MKEAKKEVKPKQNVKADNPSKEVSSLATEKLSKEDIENAFKANTLISISALILLDEMFKREVSKKYKRIPQEVKDQMLSYKVRQKVLL